jgi:hypothetical protein
MSRTPSILVAIIVALVLSLAACGDGDEDTNASTGDVTRYCEIARELDRAGAEQFEELEQDPEATRADFEAAEARLYEENEDLIAEGQQVAPPEIQEDLDTLVTGLRARAGLTDQAPDPAELSSAERAVGRFEKDNCPAG